jgi:hypothetical protein
LRQEWLQWSGFANDRSAPGIWKDFHVDP